MTDDSNPQTPRPGFWSWLSHDVLARGAFVGAFVYSFIMTAFGFALLYHSFDGRTGDAFEVLLWGMPLALAALLHVFILRALQSWRGGRSAGYWRSVAALQIIAVLVSYGAHWTHLNAAATMVESFRAAQASVSQSAQAWVAQYAAFAQQMTALADLSTARMSDEDQHGTSCEARAGHGQGERYDLRKADLALFQGLSADVASRLAERRTLADSINKLAVDDASQAAAAAPALRAAIVHARALEADPFPQNARQALQARIAAGRGAMPIPLAMRRPNGPLTFTCPDAELERRMQASLSALDAVKPFADVELPDLRDPRNGYALALRRIAASMLHAVGLGSYLGGDLANARDWMALGFATGLEGALAFFYAGSTRLPDPGGFDGLDSALRGRRRRRAAAAFTAFSAPPDSVLRALYAHARFGRRVHIMIPVDPADDESIALHRFMEALCFAGLARPALQLEPQALSRRFFTWGWNDAAAARLRKARAARRYVISRRDFFALSLDALRPEVGCDAEVVRPFLRAAE